MERGYKWVFCISGGVVFSRSMSGEFNVIGGEVDNMVREIGRFGDLVVRG